MQKRKQQLFALALALWAFSSCSQDARDSEVSTTGGETVTFSLDAEVSVDDSDLRAIEYKLGKNAKNELVPLPQFTDKQEVEVHTILKSSNGSAVAKTLKWRYDTSKKKLVLKQDDGHSITVSGFNNDGGVKWYISGLIGGTLIDGTTRVAFAGERVLSGVNGNEGDIVGSLNVPYSFGWTELKINTKSTKEANNSYKYAEIPSSVSVKFVPRGSLVAYKLGNAQTSGIYTFTPTGFTVTTNTWGDQGEFELSTDIPTVNPENSMPLWTEDACGSNIYYTFSSGHSPSAIAHNSLADKTYYAWVMPHKAQPAASEVRVMLKGSSSRPTTATYKDYTKTYFTDYTPKSTGTHGKVVEGKVHKLTARAIQRVPLPIEFVTEHNLAGGEGLTETVRPEREIQFPFEGTRGPLRFASSHANNQSGYYNFEKITGKYDADYNPNSANLSTAILIDTDGSSIVLSDKYLVPTQEQLHGIFSPVTGAIFWDETSEESLGADEQMAVSSRQTGLQHNFIFRQSYKSDYSKSVTSPLGGNYAADNAVVYSIRFQKRQDCSPMKDSDYPGITYPSALDNSMKCAYRFTRIGGSRHWGAVAPRSMHTGVAIDVVYLGEEDNLTDLATISDEAWWSAKKTEGEVLTRTFSIPGYVTRSGGWNNLGFDAFYSSFDGAFWINSGEIYSRDTFLGLGNPVRLFLRHVD